MKARRIDGQTPGGKRTVLADVIPLATPYMVQIFPVYGCNFKCHYCIHAVEQEKRGFIAEKGVLDFEVYKKFIDDLTQFPSKIKMLRFAGTGEPLLHKHIADMIAYAGEKQVAEAIDIVTNGEMLTNELSDKLIKAGLSKLRISLQGLTAIKYKEVCGKEIEYDKFLENVEYFYNNRGNTKVYIKIIDCALEQDEEEAFLEKFGDLCDYIAIEHVLPATKHIDYSNIIEESQKNFTQNGNSVLEAEVCPQPFYMMQLNPDGNIVPCCAMETTAVMGNIQNKSAMEIWNGEIWAKFRHVNLSKNKAMYKICKNCSQYKYAMFEEDILDHCPQNILEN